MNQLIKLIHLTNNKILVSQIEEISADIGEPDCKLVKPYEVSVVDDKKLYLAPWMQAFTSDTAFKISSDKILALADPSPAILESYLGIIK